jgi:hypothetical protein
LQASVWEELIPIDDYDRTFILQGVEEGFHIIDDDLAYNACNYVECSNYKSTEIFRDLVESQIIHEITHGNYVVCDRPMNIVKH